MDVLLTKFFEQVGVINDAPGAFFLFIAAGFLVGWWVVGREKNGTIEALRERLTLRDELSANLQLKLSEAAASREDAFSSLTKLQAEIERLRANRISIGEVATTSAATQQKIEVLGSKSNALDEAIRWFLLPALKKPGLDG